MYVPAPNSTPFTDPHHVLCFVVSSSPPSLPSKPDSRHATSFVPGTGPQAPSWCPPMCAAPTNTALRHTVLISFSKANLGLGPSETLTPLMGENLNVHERHVRALSVVNNKQNHRIPAAYKQA